MPPTRHSHRVASSTAPGSQRNDRQQARVLDAVHGLLGVSLVKLPLVAKS